MNEREIRMSASQVSHDQDQVKSWVKKAVSFYRGAGRQIGLAEFMNPRGQFVRDDLYIFALDLDGIMLAHPINNRFEGIDFLVFRDSDGRAFIHEIVENAKNGTCGCTDYKWYNPISREEMTKTVYYENVDGVIICGGFYREEDHHSEQNKESGDEYPENFFDLLKFLGA